MKTLAPVPVKDELYAHIKNEAEKQHCSGAHIIRTLIRDDMNKKKKKEEK